MRSTDLEDREFRLDADFAPILYIVPPKQGVDGRQNQRGMIQLPTDSTAQFQVDLQLLRQ